MLNVKIQEIVKEPNEISILRTAEEEYSLENIYRYLQDEKIEDYESEYSFNSREDTEDLNYLWTPKEKEVETDILKRFFAMENETFTE